MIRVQDTQEPLFIHFKHWLEFRRIFRKSIKHLRWSLFIEIVNSFRSLTIFTKSSIVILGSKYASVIINMVPTLASQLYSKTTKISKIFKGTPHFSLKLVQKLRNDKSSSFEGPPWLHKKTNSRQMSRLHKLSGLYLMSLMHRKELISIISPSHVTQKLQVLIIVTTHVDMISDERPKLWTKWRISRKLF